MFTFRKFCSPLVQRTPLFSFQNSIRGSSIFRPRFNFASEIENFKKLRNIGISAHIDSGKTTFTERVLFYAGRIGQIHEVKGSDNVGAKMDFMELEREKGITIQSAATHLTWGDHKINIIDTPGHVDFTIEVERALRVLDGAVLIVCGASGVQPQTLTVDKQMKRYSIPRIIFINKLDRMGANPWHAIDSIRKRLGLTASALQIPIGSDQTLKGLVDLVKMKAFLFEGPQGETIIEAEIPDSLKAEAAEKRLELIECLANLDHEIEDFFLNEKEIPIEILKAAIRRQTIALKFCPVLMGSAYKNKGVQLALNAVCDYLPTPDEVDNFGFKLNEKKPDEPEEKLKLLNDPKKPFCAYAFKLEENKFGQLTYVRVYQGKLKKGDYVYNMKVKKRMKVSRMVKMHANEMEDISEVEAGDIFAIFGLECATGDSLTEGDMSYQVNCSSLYVPAPVMSLSISPLKNEYNTKFQKALNKFRREDPTFHVNVDKESEEIIISGMGELHLQIYAERIKREFGIECEVGNPSVNYRETIAATQSFDYLHKKQSGGAGQYARVIGYIEPLPYNEHGEFQTGFQNKIVGTSIPNEFITAVEKGFYDTIEKGPQTGYPIVNVKYTLEDGVTHPVDSSSNAFAIAAKYSFLDAFNKADPQILEPIMNVEITISQNNYSDAMASISKRRGLITNTETRGDMFILNAEVPLSCMFGYATELRGMSAGTAEFSMEYKNHAPLPINEAAQVIARYKKKLRSKE